MSPSYKWVTTHIGYSSMNFSPYTLSGHEFMGGGIDLAPTDKIKVSAMYGRLNKAVNPDTLGNMPIYKRMGGGLKLEYLHKNFDVGANIFKATDDMNSVQYTTQDSMNFTAPQDNLAASFFIQTDTNRYEVIWNKYKLHLLLIG